MFNSAGFLSVILIIQVWFASWLIFSGAVANSPLTSVTDPDARPQDFQKPGHVFPLRAVEGGVLRRAGHTEAAVDLATPARSR